MAKCRDYTDKTINEFETFLDKYYNHSCLGSDNLCSFFEAILYHLRIFELFSTDGDYKAYIKTLSNNKEKAILKIKEIWIKISKVEKDYSGKFEKNSNLLQSHNNIINRLADGISLDCLNNSYEMNKLFRNCYTDYKVLVEKRVNEILNKDVSEWSNADYELVAYAYIYGEDDEQKEKILNKFCENKTENYYYDSLVDNYNVYEIRSEEWDKFKEYTDMYYAYELQNYQNGEVSDDDFNRYIQNYMTTEFIDVHKEDTLFVLVQGKKPIEIDDKGIIKVSSCKTGGYAFPEPGEDPSKRKTQIVINSMCTDTFDSNFHIANGKDAETYFDNEMAGNSISDNTYDYQAKAAALSKKYIFKGIGMVPGGGKLISKVLSNTVDIIENTIAIESGPDLTTYNQIYYGDYAEWFNLKVCMTDMGYVLMPTPITNKRIDAVMNYLKEHNLTDTYKTYYRKSKKDYYNGKFPIDEFISNLDTMAQQGILDQGDMQRVVYMVQ